MIFFPIISLDSEYACAPLSEAAIWRQSNTGIQDIHTCPRDPSKMVSIKAEVPNNVEVVV